MAKGSAHARFLQDKPGGPPQRLPIRISPPPVRTFSKPRLNAPPGACDCHVHVFGPQKRYPVSAARINSPVSDVIYEDATVDDLVEMLDATGMTRGVYVGSMLYGERYDIMVNAMTRIPDRLRGVAIIDPSMTDGELELLDKAGVVGARIAQMFSPTIDDIAVRRALELDWTVNYVGRDWTSWREPVLATPGRFILEHMGELDPTAGFNSETFRFLLAALDTGRCWIKLSARMSHEEDFPFGDLLPYVHKLIEHAPTRILYGSDWPHPVYFGRPMVDDAKLLDMLLDWAPDETTRHRILVENPAEAYRWPL